MRDSRALESSFIRASSTCSAQKPLGDLVSSSAKPLLVPALDYRSVHHGPQRRLAPTFARARPGVSPLAPPLSTVTILPGLEPRVTGAFAALTHEKHEGDSPRSTLTSSARDERSLSSHSRLLAKHKRVDSDGGKEPKNRIWILLRARTSISKFELSCK